MKAAALVNHMAGLGATQIREFYIAASNPARLRR
jgi:hypothetical protein